MKTEWIVIAGLVLVIVVGAAFWVGSQDQPPVNNGRGNTINPPTNDRPIDDPRGDDNPIDVLPEETFPPLPDGLVYEFGAKFEPPVGRLVHGVGQFDEYNEKYYSLVGADHMPVSELIFIAIGDSPRPWDKQKIKQEIFEMGINGRIPSINITLSGNFLTQQEIKETNNPYFGIDEEVANSSKYDSRIQDIIDIIKDYKRPVMLRIGGEFNGWWDGHEPYQYPKAYRKIVDMFRDQGVDNVAFVWCWEPAAPDDYFEQNAAGEYKWFPGDDYIDWYGIDLFHNGDVGGPEKTAAGKLTSFGKVTAFLDAAKAHNRPVVLAETSPQTVDITTSLTDGQADWDAWFKPYFQLMKDYPIIKWFHYINYDWDDASYYAPTWDNADISINTYIMDQYTNEIENPEYLHADERYLLKNYLDYK